ncbi:DUF3800 domain-containing protein [Patescibacteria group bacterium]|nr:DUF3800 domain-containing protein [Patescibacteria group bacterium]
MSFFKFHKEIETRDLKLSDYDQIWSKFCFFDESGSLSNVNDPLFTIGIIKISQPYYLSSKICYERSKRKFFDELKFNKLSRNNLDFAKFVIDSFFDTKGVNFYSYTIDKEGDYFYNNFSREPWQIYEDLTMKLLQEAVLSPKEILILIADYITTPNTVKYEVNIKREMNNRNRRLTMAGVCRFDSKANDLLQLVDLLIGAVSYDVKLSAHIVSGDKYKIALVKYLKANMGAVNFIDNGFRDRTFNIFVDKDIKKRVNSSTQSV